MFFIEPPVTSMQVYSVSLRGTGHRYPGTERVNTRVVTMNYNCRKIFVPND